MLNDAPKEIQPLLNDYLQAFEQQLPNLLGTLYLHGSITLGAFQPDWSDIDFIAVLNRLPNENEYKIIENIHKELIINYKTGMDGRYILKEDLIQQSGELRGFFNEGVFDLRPFANQEVTLWLLMHKSLVITGDKLQVEVDLETLLCKMHENMNTYWKGFLSKPDRIRWVFFSHGIQWVILGTLRQYYTFCEKDITSKIGAGDYALSHFPQWQKIIQEAINIRLGKTKSLYANPLHRAFDAYRFLHFIIQHCNQMA